MTATATATLNLGGTALSLDLVTESNAILGKRGSGKTTAGIVLFEEIFGHGVPVVSIDPKGDHWGLRAGADGSPNGGLAVAVFGGLHGDIPLEADAGAFVADLLREKSISAVLDVSEFSSGERRRFLTAFVDRLYRRPEREPMHLLIEEAHELVPQRVDAGDAAMVGAFERLVKLGRFKGIGVTMLSQRSASLNKNVLTQVDNLFMMRTVSPQDRAAVKAWIDTHAESSAIIDSLPKLATGECWLWQPEHGEPVQFRFRLRSTYDAGTTPRVGQAPRPSAVLTQIDLADIRAAMSETPVRASESDPKKLRELIASQKKQIEQLTVSLPAPAPVPVEVRVEVAVPVLPEAVSSGRLRDVEAQVESLLEQLGALQAEISGFTAAVLEVESGLAAAKVPVPLPVPVQSASSPARVASSVPRVPSSRDQNTKLRAGAVRMVESLGRMQPLRLTKSQWGMVSGLKTSGGTWSTYLSDLRRLAFIDENAAGFTLTDAGFDFLGGRPAPMTATELQSHYRQILRAGAARMLDAIMDVYPFAISKSELGEAVGIATSGGTFSTYLSDLTRNGLIDKQSDGLFRATDILMNGAEQ
ncbi:MAG TPA: helicase HerA-like domain-containing protein [Candidatus Lumbricidophila sp.]|nr:helicase HerA-like domain-containing protein [Candidatus Lumbricidophila sp.]